MRLKIIAGNWKMNCVKDEAKLLVEAINSPLNEQVLVLVFPPILYLEGLIANEVSGIKFGAQNFSQYDSGAYTGEVSATMIKSVGVQFALIGHSERRGYFSETDEVLKSKIDQAIKNELNVIFCCGESLETRTAGMHNSFVLNQLKNALGHLNDSQVKNVMIAYEPIWAIGTGITATSLQAQEMHNEIRNFFEKHWNNQVASKLHILYGGSLNARNADELLSMPDIDGGLIGGASLKAEEFNTIISIAESLL